VITRLPDCVRRELGVSSFEFLKAHDVGLGFSKSAEQVRQAAINVVDVKLAIFIGSATDTRHGF
jgi:hypothetical protein